MYDSATETNSHLANGSSNSLLEDLSQQISINAKVLSEYLSSAGYPQPSFDRNGPATVLPPAASESAIVARQHLKEAARKVFELASGPNEYLENVGLEVSAAIASRPLHLMTRQRLDRFPTKNLSVSVCRVSPLALPFQHLQSSTSGWRNHVHGARPLGQGIRGEAEGGGTNGNDEQSTTRAKARLHHTLQHIRSAGHKPRLQRLGDIVVRHPLRCRSQASFGDGKMAGQ